MNASRSQEAESALYVFDGAETPAEYQAALSSPDENEMAEWLAGRPSFLKRQLKKATKTTPTVWDWIFGALMPVFCFVADPIVFKNAFFSRGDGFLSDFSPFAHLLSFLSIMSLAAWLIWGERLKGLAALVSGVMFAGAVISLAIGFLLLPLSLFGMIFLIGLLGFTPFFTFMVLWRNAMRAFIAAKPHFESGVLTRTVGLSALFTLAIPMIFNAAMGVNMMSRLVKFMIR
jgi:hypothetical protein